ncbi:MAG: T9SS type A sorting domain-containing protein, partial [Fidelibacterota bacterium]
LESGFPVPLASTSPVLAKNLFGDDHLELVVQVDSSDVVVLDWQGQERFRLANPKGSDLRMLGPYGGLTSIATRSTIWLFDSTTVTGGNEWPYVHHDPSNRRTLTAVLSQGKPRENLLMDRGRTYNYPNPAEDGRTSIRVFVESADRVEIMIYDVAGFFVRKFTMDSPVRSEVNEVVWDVSGVESGLYFANVVALRGDDSESKILKIAVIH